MELQIKGSDTAFTITGNCKDVQNVVEQADAALGMLFVGIIMGLHFGNDGVMEANLNRKDSGLDDRPLEFSTKLGEDGQPEVISCRFLDQEVQS